MVDRGLDHDEYMVGSVSAANETLAVRPGVRPRARVLQTGERILKVSSNRSIGR